MSDPQEGKLRYFTAEGEPLPEDIDHEDTRIAFQLRGEDAKRKAKEWQKAREDEASIQAKTEAKARKAAEKSDNKAHTEPPQSKGESDGGAGSAPGDQDGGNSGESTEGTDQDGNGA